MMMQLLVNGNVENKAFIHTRHTYLHLHKWYFASTVLACSSPHGALPLVSREGLEGHVLSTLPALHVAIFTHIRVGLGIGGWHNMTSASNKNS